MLRVGFSLKNVLIWPKMFYDLWIKNSDFGKKKKQKKLNIWNASRCWKTNQTKKRKQNNNMLHENRPENEEKCGTMAGKGTSPNSKVTNTLNYVK